ncbi:MAG: DEAD/DEAH box helicase [Deltaproteobacteria bacterium]|nr:DEAD/DEAH box helicase [Deltaproteobacteria bacterium]
MYTGAIPQHDVETTRRTFSSLGLSPAILDSIRSIGFEHPTEIQSLAIRPALAGDDLIGLAQTGSGKTAAFALPMAQRLTHGRGLRGLILCPTREIALQTKAFLDLFGQDHKLRSVCVIGGVKMGPQIQRLRQDPDIVVATPGRLFDHMERRNVSLRRVRMLVIDEADHMLDLGFLPQIRRILEAIPERRQTLMFSATMPPPIERLAQRFMKEPVRIDVLPAGRAAEGISHRLYMVQPEDRTACLLELLQQETGSTLIFIRRKIDAEWLCKQLEPAGMQVERIHSNLSQGQRVAALQGLRSGEHRILIATDIAARGIDIPVIEHIINFTLPEKVEDYIHRAGRTARGTADGLVSSIATWQDLPRIREIEKTIEKELPRCVVPGIEPYVERKKTIKGRKLLRRRLL